MGTDVRGHLSLLETGSGHHYLGRGLTQAVSSAWVQERTSLVVVALSSLLATESGWKLSCVAPDKAVGFSELRTFESLAMG